MKLSTSLSAVIVVSIAGITSVSASNQNRHRDASPAYIERVPVVDVRPLYRYVRVNQPNRDCYYETTEDTHKKSSTGKAIIGAIIGGAIGRKLGKNKSHGGRNARTVAGAGIGALIGNSLGKNRTEAHRETRRVCRRVNNYHEERRLTGFRAYYKFRGRRYHSDVRREPGRTMRIRFVGRPLDR